MAAPGEIVDAFESVLGIYFSGVRHRERAAFILCDELVEMACKLRARESNHQFSMQCNFHQAWNASGVAIPADPLGNSIQGYHNTRNTMQHASAAVTVDTQYCADAIMCAVAVVDHCWHGASGNQFPPWMKCALRIALLYSSHGDPAKRGPFEDAMRSESWRGAEVRLKRNEVAIHAGRRDYWTLLMTQSQMQVEGVLDALGIP